MDKESSVHNEITFLRELRHKAAQGLCRGRQPCVSFEVSVGFWQSILGALGVGVIVLLVSCLLRWLLGLTQWSWASWVLKWNYSTISNMGFTLGFCGALLLPYWVLLANLFPNRGRVNFLLLRSFSWGQKLAANLIASYWLTYWLYFPFEKNALAFVKANGLTLSSNSLGFSLIALGIILLQTGMYFSVKLATGKGTTQRGKQRTQQSLPFGLWLGETTGRLAELWHTAGAAPQQQVGLFRDDAAQNLLVLGAIGSGKTTSVIHPCLLQLLEQECGGLIFDIKGDFRKAVDALAHTAHRSFVVLGPSNTPFNLIQGLTPEMAASFLKSGLMLDDASGSKFWIDTASDLCRNALGVLSFLHTYYSLNGLYRYLFEKKWQQARNEELASLNLDSAQQRLLESYQHYVNEVFGGFNEKTQADVYATISQALSSFTHPALIDAFCLNSPNQAALEEVLNGQVFLIDLPLANWGLSGKVVYTFIKLRFFNIMQQRALQSRSDTTAHPGNREGYVFFLCDEYQEIVSANKNGLSDLNFWDKSRSSKTVGIISAQSVSSFYSAIGNRDLADTILQNFRQKICFRTEDQHTISLFNRLLGNVEVQRVTHSRNSGTSTPSLLAAGKAHGSSQDGESTSISTQEKPLLDGQFFRTLNTGYALAVISYCGMGFDDVLAVRPIYTD